MAKANPHNNCLKPHRFYHRRLTRETPTFHVTSVCTLAQSALPFQVLLTFSYCPSFSPTSLPIGFFFLFFFLSSRHVPRTLINNKKNNIYTGSFLVFILTVNELLNAGWVDRFFFFLEKKIYIKLILSFKSFLLRKLITWTLTIQLWKVYDLSHISLINLKKICDPKTFSYLGNWLILHPLSAGW